MSSQLQPAKFYKKIKDDLIQCRLCNHFCTIENKAIGNCGVRQNIGGKLYSLVYGRPAVINIDPIEKKPLSHFLPGSQVFSIGTIGCNFRCLNCLNHDISQAKEINDTMIFRKPEEIVALAVESGCQSIAYTYNEPTVFTEYALDIMQLAKKNGLKNVWVSNGFMSNDCLEAITPYLDAVSIDLKFINEESYQKVCGASVQPVLDNLIYFKKHNIHIEVITLVIPTLSDQAEMFTKIAKFIKQELGVETPWHLSSFSPAISWQLKSLPNTSLKTLDTAYEIGEKAGLKYIYLGNVHNDQRTNTFCPKCNALVIERIGYGVTRFNKNGSCPKCKQNLNIVL